jgi:pectinesterase
VCGTAGAAAGVAAGDQARDAVGAVGCDTIEIHIAPGTYHEHLDITEPYVALIGAGPDETIITGDLGGYEILADGLKRGTFRTQTVFVHTHDFTARDLTIENAAGPGHIAGQAIALYADGDRLYFENVHLKGFQDTLFTGPLPPKEVERGGFRGPLEHAPRINGWQYYRKCTIEGSIDFIFGSATAYFEECTLVSRDEYWDSALRNDELRNKNLANAESTQIKDAPPVRGYVTAASTPEGQKYGYVFADCTFTGDCPAESCYLGRPWREFARVVLIRCSIGSHIRPEGWHDWGKEAAHETATFAEFECSYAGKSEDVAGGLRRHLSAEDVLDYAKDKVIS